MSRFILPLIVFAVTTVHTSLSVSAANSCRSLFMMASTSALNWKLTWKEISKDKHELRVSDVNRGGQEAFYLVHFDKENLTIKVEQKELETGRVIESEEVHMPFAPKYEVGIRPGFDGLLIEPVRPDLGSAPKLLFLHGSGGAQHPVYLAHALFFASQGYRVLQYHYFNSFLGPLPGALVNIPVDRASLALRWLDGLSTSPVGVVGSSRGAEKAQLFSHLLEVFRHEVTPDAIVVDRGIDKIVGAFSPELADPANWKNGIVGEDPVRETWQGVDMRPFETLSQPAWTWEGRPLGTDFTLEPEKIRKPILYVHGERDEVWGLSRIENVRGRFEDIEPVWHEPGKPIGEHPFVGRIDGAHFHFFKNEPHAFSPWAQSERYELILKFLELHMEESI